MKMKKYELIADRVIKGEFECEDCGRLLTEGETFYTSPIERGMDYIDAYCPECSKKRDFQV